MVGSTNDKADGEFMLLYSKELRDLHRPSWEIKERKARREGKVCIYRILVNKAGKKTKQALLE
jgi:hypothetical protein